MNEPVVAGPAAFNLTHPEPFSWKSAVSGWKFTVAGAGDSTYDGEYVAIDAGIGLYRHAERDDRFLNYVNDYGAYWAMGAARVTYMPGTYYVSGNLPDGPADGQWSVGYGSSPAPTVTKSPNLLSGLFRWRIVEDDGEADPEGWSEPSGDLSVTPEGLAAGDYRLLVQEQVDDDEWTDAGEFAFTASAYLLPAPAVDGPPLINATHALFSWRTGKPGGWMFTASGAGDATYNGVYLAQDAERGVYVNQARNDRFLYYDTSYSRWSMSQDHYSTYMAAYYCAGTLAGGPNSVSWYADYGYGPPMVTKEDLTGLTGQFQWQIADGPTPDPERWSETSEDVFVEQTGLVPGEYRLFVREHVDGDEWTEVAGFDFTVAFQPIPAPVISGLTPTDIFTPALDIRTSAPGPDGLLVLGAGTIDANGLYIPEGTVNGFPCYRKAGAEVYLWNVPDYSSRKWIIQESASPPVETTGSYYSGGFWYYVYNSSGGGNRPPATGWSRSNGVANAPTLRHGAYPEGEGTGGFQFRVDGGEWSETFTGTSFTLPEQASGVHAVEAREMGENGLWSEAAPFSIETSLIAAPAVTGPEDSDGGWHITFTWSAASGARGTKTFRYRMNGGPWSPEKAGAATGNTATTVAQLLDGYNAFEAQEKSTTGHWGMIGLHEVLAVNAISGAGNLPIPPGSRVVVMDPAGREYLWGPEAGQLSRQYEPQVMSAPDGAGEARYLFVTSSDKYHLPDCPYGQTGVLLTVPELIARAAVPCGHCKPPALN